MKVWTVVSQDDHPKYGNNHCVIGTYTARGRALDECVDYIVERLKTCDDLAFCMAHDENHPEAAEFFSGGSDRSDRWHVKRGKKTALRDFLRDELGGQGCYYAYSDYGMGWLSFHFNVDENDVEGQLWTTVTWGDSNCEDPDFTTPWPETFTNKESAVNNFCCYAADLMRSCGMNTSGEFRKHVSEQLESDGRCQVDLSDGCCINCVLYSTSMEGVRE